MLTLRLPDPSLVVLVGPAGAGKTTFAARHFEPAEVLSSDELRERIAGDAADQSATRMAFSLLHHSLARRLAIGQLTVVDATNVESGARRALLAVAARSSVPAVAIALDVPLALAQRRNAERSGRVVEPAVVARQWRTLVQALAAGALHADGFAMVVRLGPDEAETVRLERRAMLAGRRA